MQIRSFYFTLLLLMLNQMGHSQHLNFMVNDSAKDQIKEFKKH
jgi:hypothetical protein